MKIEGRPVVDGKKPLSLTINKRDVRSGEAKDPTCCAAARACIRQIPDAVAARVHISRIYVDVGKKWLRFKASDALRTEIIAFDRGGSFVPGKYILEPLVRSKRATGQRQGSETAPRGPYAKTKRRHTVAGIRSHGSLGAEYAARA